MSRLTRLVQTSYTTQSYDNAYWMMAIMYEHGQQWGYVNPVGGEMRVRYLRNLTDPQRNDVRVTMNKIGEFVRQVKAETNPHSFQGVRYDPSSGSINHRLIANLGSKLMNQHLKDIRALEVYRDMNLARAVLGSCFIRRTLILRSERIFSQIVGGDIRKRPLREFSVGWARCYPWEFLRDPAAIGLRPAEEENIICHYKPRTVQWVKERFPNANVETQTTMGRLMTYNRQIRAATGMVGNARAANSTEPAVMVYEAYIKEGNAWPYTLFAFGDPFGAERVLKPMAFMPNPFFDLPIHMFHYDHPVQMPWGRGIPHILMNAQDLSNLSWTWMIRTMQAGAGKWLIEKGTVERPQRQLSNRIDKPIEWDRMGAGATSAQAQAPQFIPGPQPSQSAMNAITMAPDWMSKALNLSPVQQGITSKRGESASAIEAKLQQAGVPLEDLRREDELELARLLQYTLYDMTNKKWIRPDIVSKLLGPDVPGDHVRLLAREGTKEAVGGVSIPTTMLRPKTKSDTREMFSDLVVKQIVQAIDAQWEMWKQNGVVINTGMARSAEKQSDEIARMLAGADVDVTAADQHVYHIRQLQEYIDSPEWHNVPKKARQRITDHFAQHKVTMIEMSNIDAMGAENAQGMAPPAQGSPPAEMAGAPTMMPGGPAGSPEMAVA